MNTNPIFKEMPKRVAFGSDRKSRKYRTKEKVWSWKCAICNEKYRNGYYEYPELKTRKKAKDSLYRHLKNNHKNNTTGAR